MIVIVYIIKPVSVPEYNDQSDCNDDDDDYNGTNAERCQDNHRLIYIVSTKLNVLRHQTLTSSKSVLSNNIISNAILPSH